MNRYSRSSLAMLKTCHRDLQLIFEVVLQICDHSIICGHRNEADQNKAFDNGFSKLRFPDGNHNDDPSMAIDASPYLPDIKIDGNNSKHLKYFYHFSGIVLGVSEMLFQDGQIEHKLRWGGDWDMDDNMDDQKFNDLYHYELIKAERHRLHPVS